MSSCVITKTLTPANGDTVAQLQIAKAEGGLHLQMTNISFGKSHMTTNKTIECFGKSTCGNSYAFFQKFHLQEKIEALNKHPEEDGELKSKLSSELKMKQHSCLKWPLEEIYNLIFEHLTYSAIWVPNGTLGKNIFPQHIFPRK